jgi:Flp pilus assembly protein TadD/cold shock CspA family protein
LHLTGAIEAEQVLGTALYDRAFERLTQDDAAAETPSLALLLHFTDFGDLVPLINRNKQYLPPQLVSYIRDVSAKLEQMIPIRNRVAHSRPLATSDLPVAVDLTTQLASASMPIWKQLREVKQQLTSNPNFVLGVKIPVATVDSTRIRHNLPTPDFDETGFIGRERETDLVVKSCLGPYPVTSLIGEGGAGKTAVALNVAYKLLDHADTPFDAIIWVSCKTQLLTVSEIRRIEGAITTSFQMLGAVAAVAEELGGPVAADPISELLEYLETFRILLILDNLETVIDDAVRQLLDRLPNGSKVLLTSRIGLGAYDRPIRLPPMSNHDAVALMRTLAMVRQVPMITRVGNKSVERYCERLKFNPGFIKWFVTGVQTGSRPEDLLAKPELFLEYCMSNVYEYLNSDARSILNVLVTTAGQRSQAELAFLSGMTHHALEDGLSELLRTNMISLVSLPMESTYESVYELTDLARAYLAKHHPVDRDTATRIARKKNELIAATEQMTHETDKRPYQIGTIALRSKRDVIVAKKLAMALDECRHRDFVRAQELIDEARALAPEYYEVYRIEGFVRASAGDTVGARLAYESAIDLAPASAPLRFFFGGYLLRVEDDSAAAARQLERAKELDPKSIEIVTELARAYLYLHDFAGAAELLAIHEESGLEEWIRRRRLDLRLQCATRAADVAAARGEAVTAVVELERAKTTFAAIPVQLIDKRMIGRLERVVSSANLALQRLRATGASQDMVRRAEDVVDWVEAEVQRPYGSERALEAGQAAQGTITDLPTDQTYGFVLVDAGPKLFFHRSDMIPVSDWERLCIGTRIAFKIGKERDGERLVATEVAVTELADPRFSEPGTVLQGRIVTLQKAKGFGFLRSTEGPRYFFHRSNMRDVRDWMNAEIGDEVVFTVSIRGATGRIEAILVERRREQLSA